MSSDESESYELTEHDGAPDPRSRIELGVRTALKYVQTRREHARAIISDLERTLGVIDGDVVREWALIDVVRAFVSFREARFDDAMAEARRADAALADSDDDVAWKARARQCIGAALASKGELRPALTELDVALDLATRACDKLVQAQILIYVGNTRQDLGELGAALTAYERAIAIGRELSIHRLVAIVLNNVGNVNSKLGELETARAYYAESLATLRDHPEDPSPSSEANALNNLAKNYELTGDYATALEYFSAALDKWTQANDLAGVAVASNNVGAALDRLERYDDAIEYFERSYEISERVGNRIQAALALANLASSDRQRGDLAAAKTRIDRALEMAEGTEGASALLAVLRNAYRIYRALGEFEQALEMFRRVTELERTLNDVETRRRVLTIESDRKLELAQKEAEIERLRNVELAEAHARLQATHEELEAAHRELKSAQSQLVHAEKMASLGQLTAGIAHEINNPINFVRASIAPLRRDLDEVRTALDEALELLSEHDREIVRRHLATREVSELRSEIDALLRGIEDGASRTAEIVKSLRTFSRLDEDTSKEIDVHEGIDATLALLRAKLGDGIEVVRTYGKVPRVECHPGQINQVIMNLLTNSIDACDGSGRIEIATSSDNGDVRILVRDNGSGIARDHLDRIFDPFFTTKPVGAGQGLGLSIAHGIVERHGGRIEVQSSGTGTQVTVVLPV